MKYFYCEKRTRQPFPYYYYYYYYYYYSVFGHDQSDPQSVVLDKVGSFPQVIRCSPELVFRAVGSGQKCCWLDMLGQVCIICSGICSLSPHSQRAVGWRPIFLRCWCRSWSWNIVSWAFLSLAGGCCLSLPLIAISLFSPLDFIMIMKPFQFCAYFANHESFW
jgi:hypothetical protein